MNWMPPKNSTVVVGMSGGVDSSVSAYLLKQAGYRVIGLFMKNWEDLDGSCPAEEDYTDVKSVCERLEIPYYSIEFVEEYRKQVFAEFLRDYQAGHTPNPDVLCNREIKFNVFLKEAVKLGADVLATGHYAQIVHENGAARLYKGLDPGKDQSYFIYTLTSPTLSRVCFPIGGMLKTDVRRIAEEAGLSTAKKKDSTGICFIGERDFPSFLGQYIKGAKGPFKTLEGERVGTHQGAVFYTPGQRRGLGLGGEGDRWYVVGKDIQENVVFVERGDDHPALYADSLTATEESWVESAPSFPARLKAKIRYRQADQDCTVTRALGADGSLRLMVEFDQPQRAIASRQSVVFYDGERLVGGAMIDTPGLSHYARSQVARGSFG